MTGARGSRVDSVEAGGRQCGILEQCGQVHQRQDMDAADNKKSLLIGGPGLFIQMGGQAVGGLAGTAVSIVGTIMLVAGLCFYARGKGYPAILGVVGILSCIGLLILAVLPDKRRDASEDAPLPAGSIRPSVLRLSRRGCQGKTIARMPTVSHACTAFASMLAPGSASGTRRTRLRGRSRARRCRSCGSRRHLRGARIRDHSARSWRSPC